uniref:NAC052 n=1 Tax=Arundo donax TaxID=35708 RepID=A0A0A9DEX2_ARUDO
MKRSLVFYRGKPPSGSKTDWVMHEYRLAGAGLAPCRRAVQAGDKVDAASTAVSRPVEGWVLCRVFRKKGLAAANASPADRTDADGVTDEQVAEDGPGAGFIDFFARAAADAARRRQQRRASSPVVSSSCLTDASHEQHSREQETTSRGA